MDELVSLCKRRGFIFQTSEIYGGINGFWDYGPLGVELKRNIRDYWWRALVLLRENIVGLDAAIIMHPKVWEASGHVDGFTDPMIDCKTCKARIRADQTDSTPCPMKPSKSCSACDGELTEPRNFNLMFKTYVGPLEDSSAVAFLRPETAQGIFAQYQNVLAVSRQKVPFGIAQIGKAFRNEINPRNYTFRSREFEQMELEFFIKPGTDEQWHSYWVEQRTQWYEKLGIPKNHLHHYTYPLDELAHYASACVDIMYDFPFGTQELEGIAARGNFDLTQHQKHSGKSMEYFDQDAQEKYIPHVIEPSAGVDRIALAILCNAYHHEWVPKKDDGKDPLPAEPKSEPPPGYESRIVMKLSPIVAPVKVAVFPLLKNRDELVKTARELFEKIRSQWPSFYDQTGAIGRRYRRQDEIGTPYCVTIDFDTLTDQTVTLRERDSMLQERIPIARLMDVLNEKIKES